MIFENEELGLSFEVPDRLNVRQQLKYWAAATFAERQDLYERYWQAAKTLIEPDSWKADGLTLDADLEKLYDNRHAKMIQYAGLAVFQHVNALEEIPKE